MKEVKLIIESSVSDEALVDYIKKQLNLNIDKIYVRTMLPLESD